MNVIKAQPDDIAAWLQLASEVEPLFGPMVAEPSFLNALQKNVNRGTALCIRESEGIAGYPLMGGLLYSPKPPCYTIGWLAVAQAHQRQGAGQKVLEYMISLIQLPAELLVTTFGQDVEGGRPARQFYRKMGFSFADTAPNGPEGGSRIIMRRILK